MNIKNTNGGSVRKMTNHRWNLIFHFHCYRLFADGSFKLIKSNRIKVRVDRQGSQFIYRVGSNRSIKSSTCSSNFQNANECFWALSFLLQKIRIYSTLVTLLTFSISITILFFIYIRILLYLHYSCKLSCETPCLKI